MTVSHRAIVALSVWLLGGMAVALAVLLLANESSPGWVAPTAVVVFVSVIAVTAVVAGWMLGRVFARHGGWLGILFTVGAVAGPAGQFNDLPLLMWPGYGALLLGLAGLVLLAIRSFRRLAGRVPKRRRPARRRQRVGRARAGRTG